MIIELQNTISNVSLQVGDYAYKVATANGVATQSPTFIGEIIAVGGNTIEVPENVSVDSGDFIMFSKNKVANDSGVTGYFADVKLVNSSTSPAELFALSSEVSESSK